MQVSLMNPLEIGFPRDTRRRTQLGARHAGDIKVGSECQDAPDEDC
ncbi:hypothetical protein HanIR_Chr11g0549911 [Helianthus annuus]|nr:hypothetical protein HanIR_Chr11g0549911 [Helianthus annuus]